MIGVLDLLGGRAVHAERGLRARYRPVSESGGRRIGGDLVALASSYLHHLRLSELYIADLDAIQGREPDLALLGRLAALGAPLWIDAGVSSPAGVRRLQVGETARIIVGLETLASWPLLREVAEGLGPEQVAFSLDLDNGTPRFSPNADRTLRDHAPEGIAERAAEFGAAAVIVLDLARVGTGLGPDLGTIERVRRAVPDLLLIAGGGVAGREDLRRLWEAGCDGALVATAIHDGRVGAREVRDASRLRRIARG